ncbi:hypothetical protein LMC02_09760 [Limosilactobacillus reuteri]|uniref:hypothetical protein n=1 Tax=Limosilactobacillus reuteri TaxID=1598 RepID=UPI001E31FFBB|nr:hypothetical protein [Limosilactobacillus reuteri]MCC4500272.1 hypothetical protein [Limosilactobacillus reuteri]MCC4500597.1 hypothetical protein [Limosilactobacillus reuteri]
MVKYYNVAVVKFIKRPYQGYRTGNTKRTLYPKPYRFRVDQRLRPKIAVNQIWFVQNNHGRVVPVLVEKLLREPAKEITQYDWLLEHE